MIFNNINSIITSKLFNKIIYNFKTLEILIFILFILNKLDLNITIK